MKVGSAIIALLSSPAGVKLRSDDVQDRAAEQRRGEWSGGILQLLADHSVHQLDAQQSGLATLILKPPRTQEVRMAVP
jgi:hypothetical protein